MYYCDRQSFFLPRIVGIGKAMELCATGRTFRAKEEEASGLFNHIVDAREGVLPKALEIAEEIAVNTSPTSVALTKAMLW